MRTFPLMLAALLVLPGADAQAFDTVTVEATDVKELEFTAGQATAIPVDVTVGCKLIVDAGGSLDVDLTTDLPPSWGASGDTVSFAAGADCLSQSGSVTESGAITVNPAANATALQKRTFQITADADGTTDTFDYGSDVWVAYRPHHTMSTNITFPYTFTNEDGDTLEFDVVLTSEANADTMVMFEQIQTQGLLSGLRAHQFLFSQGSQRTEVLKVTWTPPTTAWDNATISFFTYSHCLADFPACDMASGGQNFPQNVTWTIQNDSSRGGGGDGDKGSPGFGGVFLLAALGAALLARRR